MNSLPPSKPPAAQPTAMLPWAITMSMSTAATKHGIPVGNTPGVLTETTAQMAVTLTFAAARRTGEAERFLRAGKYKGWLMTLFLGELLWRKTVGVIGAGRIGATYARMMVEGHKMNLIYYDIYPNKDLEDYIAAYADFLKSRGEEPVSCKRADTVEDVLREADCVSVHTVLDESTHHLINAASLALMKENAILVNTSRGPVVDEAALVAHCRKHPNFRAGLDVFEDEPAMKPGLVELDNVADRPPHCVGNPLDPGRYGLPGGRQCGRHPVRLPGLEPAGYSVFSGGRITPGSTQHRQCQGAGYRALHGLRRVVGQKAGKLEGSGRQEGLGMAWRLGGFFIASQLYSLLASQLPGFLAIQVSGT